MLTRGGVNRIIYIGFEASLQSAYSDTLLSSVAKQLLGGGRGGGGFYIDRVDRVDRVHRVEETG